MKKQSIWIDEKRDSLLQLKKLYQASQENQNTFLEKVSIREPSADLVFEIRENANVQSKLEPSLLHILLHCPVNQWHTRVLKGKSINGLRWRQLRRIIVRPWFGKENPPLFDEYYNRLSGSPCNSSYDLIQAPQSL